MSRRRSSGDRARSLADEILGYRYHRSKFRLESAWDAAVAEGLYSKVKHLVGADRWETRSRSWLYNSRRK